MFADVVVSVDVVIDGAVDMSATFVIHVDDSTLIIFVSIATTAAKGSIPRSSRLLLPTSTTRVALMSTAPFMPTSRSTITSTVRACFQRRQNGRLILACAVRPHGRTHRCARLIMRARAVSLREDYLALRTVVVGTPIAVARRASVSRDGVWRPASTRAMFGR